MSTTPVPAPADLSLDAARYRAALNALCLRVRRLADTRKCTEEAASALILGDRRRLRAIDDGGFITPESMQAAAVKLDRYEAQPRLRAPKGRAA